MNYGCRPHSGVGRNSRSNTMQAKQAKSLAELSELVGGMVEGDPSQQVLSVAPPEQAGADDLVFLLSNDPIECSASAAVMSVDAPAGEYAHRIRVSEPKLAMARILGALFPRGDPPQRPSR